MAAATTTEKQPSVIGFYFYAIIAAVLGACLGLAYLATFPAQAFASEQEYLSSLEAATQSEAPVYIKPGDAYYIEGPILRGRSWETKRDQLAAAGPQTIRFSAGEINGWMAAKFRPADTPAGDEAKGVLIVPGVPNVGLADNGIFLNLPVSLSAYGSSGDYTLSVFGSLTASGLQIKSMRVSSAKIPLPNLIGQQFLNTLAKGYQSTEEYMVVSGAFDRAESITIDGGELIIVLR